ncbi:hypothetical protein [Nonomuraea sp. NPDC050691]|uniref:hypothetical protein n=1 Tax=Nonomuraea sp. NPDC050691 TaxID=3155661 RepID=UPI0033E46D38
MRIVLLGPVEGQSRLAAERRRSGDLDGALRDIEAARQQAAERGLRRMEAEMRLCLAGVHRASGDLGRAEEALDRLEAVAHRLPYPPEVSRGVTAGNRMANRLAEGAAGAARELLPAAVRGHLALGNADGLAWGVELEARLLTHGQAGHGQAGQPGGA